MQLKKKYTHLLFDLDQTLWDFRKNAVEIIHRLYNEFELEKQGIPDFKEYLDVYKTVNYGLWDKYRNGEIDKQQLNNSRFTETLKQFSDNSGSVGSKMAALYIDYSPENITLFDDTLNVLEYLNKNYRMHIISNGFEEIQFPKLKKSGLDIYFENVILSEHASCLKPDIRFFEYALNKIGITPAECIVIGDDAEADVLGASKAGIDQVWYKQSFHEGVEVLENVQATHIIRSLSELKNIL